MTGAVSVDSASGFRSRTLTAPAAGLLVLWFIPEVLSSPPLFPFHLMTRLNGMALAGLIAAPIGACLVLVLAVSPLPRRPKAVGTFLSGLCASVIPLVSYVPLPVSGAIVIPAVLAGIISGAAAFLRFRPVVLGYIVVSAVPAGLLVTALYGLVSSGALAAYLSILKSPIALFLTMSISAISAVRVLRATPAPPSDAPARQR